jgi:hypothetical protein
MPDQTIYNYTIPTNSNFGNYAVIIFTTLQSIMYILNGIYKPSIEWWQLNFPMIVMILMYMLGLFIQGFSTTTTSPPKENL